MEDCLCVAQDEVLRVLRGAVSKGVGGAKGRFTGVTRAAVGERKHSHQRLFKRKRDKQTVPAAGRKCKFPARRKDEKRIRARTPRVY